MAGLDLQRNEKGEASWVDPRSGETFWVPQSDFDKVFQAGMRPEAPAAYADRQQRKELSNPLYGGALGLLSGVSAGIAPALLAEMDIVSGKTQQMVREESPWAYGAADVVGTIGGAVAGGPVALIGRAGAKVAAKTALKTGSKALGKVAGFGAEGALFSGAKGAEDLSIHDVDALSEEGIKHLAKTVGIGGGAGLVLGSAGMGLMKAAGAVGRTGRRLLDRGGDRAIARVKNAAAKEEAKLVKLTGEMEQAEAIMAKMDDTVTIKQTQAAATEAEIGALRGTQAEAVEAFNLHRRVGREIDETLGPWGARRNPETGLPEFKLQPGYMGKSAKSLNDSAKDLRKYGRLLAEETEDATETQIATWRAKVAQAEAARVNMSKDVWAKLAQEKQLKAGMEGLDPKLITQLDDISARHGKLLDEIDDAVRGKADQQALIGEWAVTAETSASALEKMKMDIKLETAGSIGRAVGMLQRVALRAKGGGMMFGGAAAMGGGGFMGIFAGMVAPNAMEMLAKYTAKLVTSPAAMKLGSKLSRATAAIARPEVSTGLRAVTESMLTDEDFKTIRQEVARFDPELYMEAAAMAADQTGQVAEVAEFASRSMAAYGYLKETVSQPPGPEADRMTPAEWTPTDSQKRADRARIEGALNPDRAIMAIVAEQARPEHAEALKRVHPDILDMVTRHIGQGIEERRTQGLPIPIETGRQYAMLMGDHRLLPRMYDPKHVERIQAMYQKGREQAQQGGGRKAAPQIAQKEMTSLQRALEGRA